MAALKTVVVVGGVVTFTFFFFFFAFHFWSSSALRALDFDRQCQTMAKRFRHQPRTPNRSACAFVNGRATWLGSPASRYRNQSPPSWAPEPQCVPLSSIDTLPQWVFGWALWSVIRYSARSSPLFLSFVSVTCLYLCLCLWFSLHVRLPWKIIVGVSTSSSANGRIRSTQVRHVPSNKHFGGPLTHSTLHCNTINLRFESFRLLFRSLENSAISPKPKKHTPNPKKRKHYFCCLL